jgi:hypothetical protein
VGRRGEGEEEEHGGGGQDGMRNMKTEGKKRGEGRKERSEPERREEERTCQIAS